MKATTENEYLILLRQWDSDALMALWTAKFGDIQRINARRIRMKHTNEVQRPAPNDDELYFEAVGKELFRRELLTRIVSGEDAFSCTFVPRGSNANR